MSALVDDCFLSALKDDAKGKKHKGLIFVSADDKKAEEYIQKAKTNLTVCDLYKMQRLDYKIPEEWFYTMYYCALLDFCGLYIKKAKVK